MPLPQCLSLGSRAPVAALGRAVSALNLRYLPAQSTLSLDSLAPGSSPGPGHPLPPWCGRAASATADKGRIHSCQKTTWAAFTPSHLPTQVEGQAPQGHPLVVSCTLESSTPASASCQVTAEAQRRKGTCLQSHSRCSLGTASAQIRGLESPPLFPVPSVHFLEPGRGERGLAPPSAGGVPCSPAVPGRASFILQPHAAATAALRTDGLQLMSLLAPLTLESLPGIKATRSPPGRLVTLEVAPRRLAVHQCT